MTDDRTCDRHEHGESWRHNSGEKETQSQERYELEKYTENSECEYRIENHSLWEEDRDEYSEFDEDHEREDHSESCEFAEYDRSASDRLGEDEIDRTALDLTSDEPSSE